LFAHGFIPFFKLIAHDHLITKQTLSKLIHE
jgi:hypothetical protein